MSWPQHKTGYKARLYAPGPVEVPPQVLEASARPLLHHRSAAFRELFMQVRQQLAALLCVPGEDVLLITGSGTAAFEAGLLAAVPPGSKIIGINAGKFGGRWVAMARHYGYEVIEHTLAWGEALETEALEPLLRAHPDCQAVMSTHSETSTGVLHDVQALAALCQQHVPEALVLIDAVTSLGVAPLFPKDWGLDGVFSGSQKGLMTPPGLGFLWLSERAWAQQGQTSFYLDARKERRAQQQGQTACTPAVSLVAALQAALTMLLDEGLESLWQRRERLNNAVLEGAQALGCRRFAARVSPAVAALYAPEGIAAPDIVRGFAARAAVIAGGQDHAKAVLFRPSLMGYADDYDAVTLVVMLEQVLQDLGMTLAPAQGVAACLQALAAGR